jgi:hypothetical protein
LSATVHPNVGGISRQLAARIPARQTAPMKNGGFPPFSEFGTAAAMFLA